MTPADIRANAQSIARALSSLTGGPAPATEVVDLARLVADLAKRVEKIEKQGAKP